MKTERILEMINNNEIEELKNILQDEIYTNHLKGNPGKKKRYAAMKRFFKYVTQNNQALLSPCKDIEVNTGMLSGKYNCFCDSYSVVLTMEDIGEIKPYNTDKGKYFDIEKLLCDNINDLHISRIDFNSVLAKAKSLGYKLIKSEVENSGSYEESKTEYILKYKPFEDKDSAYFKMGLFDKAFSIIDDGEPCEVYYMNRKAPLFIKTSIGLCLVLPINAREDIEEQKTIIEAMEI